MKYKDCCFRWKDEGEMYPSCKWEARAPGDMAPCDYDDYEEDEQ